MMIWTLADVIQLAILTLVVGALLFMASWDAWDRRSSKQKRIDRDKDST